MDATTRIREAAAKADQSRAVIGTDLSGTIASWNETAEKIYGWRRMSPSFTMAR